MAAGWPRSWSCLACWPMARARRPRSRRYRLWLSEWLLNVWSTPKLALSSPEDRVGCEAAVGLPMQRTSAPGGYTSAMSKRELDIASLTPEERLDLLEELWDSLGAASEAIPLTEAQRAELDRRLDDLEREGPVGIPWDEVLGRIRSRGR